jgi:hypothetical protein
MEEFMPLDEKLKLTIARWFLNSGAGDRALAIYEGNPKWAEPGAWEAMRVEVPLQGGDYDAAREAVGKVAWLLTGVKRAGFRYRIAAGRGGEDELSDSRMQLLKAAEADGDPEEVREEAEYAEARGDRELAIGLDKVLEKDPEEEVFAKLEVAKLQSAKVDGRAGAMAVLVVLGLVHLRLGHRPQAQPGPAAQGGHHLGAGEPGADHHHRQAPPREAAAGPAEPGAGQGHDQRALEVHWATCWRIMALSC